MQESVFDPWVGKMEEEKATRSSILAWRIPMDIGAWQATVRGVSKESAMTQWLKQQHRHKIHRGQGSLLVTMNINKIAILIMLIWHGRGLPSYLTNHHCFVHQISMPTFSWNRRIFSSVIFLLLIYATFYLLCWGCNLWNVILELWVTWVSREVMSLQEVLTGAILPTERSYSKSRRTEYNCLWSYLRSHACETKQIHK